MSAIQEVLKYRRDGWGFKCPLFTRDFTVHSVTEFAELYAELVFNIHLADDPEYEFGKRLTTSS